jgi:probable phosphoglycerate mutase
MDQGGGSGATGELWAVRHGQSTANAAFERARVDGREDAGLDGRDADVPLSSLGLLQAAALGRWLAALPLTRWPDVAYVSPYLRARQTLQAILEPARQSVCRPVEVRVDERLRDRETGVLELMTQAAVERRYPAEASRRHLVGEVYYRPAGGESLLDVALRLRSFLRDLDTDPARRVLVVGHDATVVMLRAITEGLDEAALAELMVRDPVLNASVSHWQRSSPRWILRSYNTTAHLLDLQERSPPS